MQKRIVTTEFSVRGGLKRFENISSKFRIEKFQGAVMNKAHIDIANLAREDVEYHLHQLCAGGAAAQAPPHFRRL